MRLAFWTKFTISLSRCFCWTVSKTISSTVSHHKFNKFLNPSCSARQNTFPKKNTKIELFLVSGKHQVNFWKSTQLKKKPVFPHGFSASRQT